MLFFYIASIISFLFIFIKDRNILRIEKQAAIELGIMSIAVFIIRAIGLTFLDVSYINEGLPIIGNMSLWKILFVFWEDLFFVAPIIYLQKHSNYKITAMVLLFLSAIIFGSAHLYQGTFAFFASIAYLVGLSFMGGKKYGLGTVMIFHVLFDISGVMAVRLFL